MRLLSLVAVCLPILASCKPHQLPATNSLSHLESRQALARKPYCLPKGGIHMIVGSGLVGELYRGYGLLDTTVNAVRAAVPGSTNYSIPYNRTDDPNVAPSAIANGTQLMIDNIMWYANGCPNTPIALIGYSEGAIIMMDTLCGFSRVGSNTTRPGLPAKYARNIIGSIAYGDESYSPKQTWDVSNCTNGSGTIPRSNNAGCAAFASNLRSYCDINDPKCCVGSPAPDENIHVTYPMRDNAVVVSYLQSQYYKRKNGTI